MIAVRINLDRAVACWLCDDALVGPALRVELDGHLRHVHADCLEAEELGREIEIGWERDREREMKQRAIKP